MKSAPKKISKKPIKTAKKAASKKTIKAKPGVIKLRTGATDAPTKRAMARLLGGRDAKHSLLSRPIIAKYREEGLITIDPFRPENLGTSQYDVTLGEFFYREQALMDPPTVTLDSGPLPIYNPFDEVHVNALWNLEVAMTLGAQGVALKGIGQDEKVIFVRPGETILAHTVEFIGGSSNRVTSMMKARSTMGRNFWEVCKCAGMGDIGYFNRWTLEITNNSQHHTLPLVVGRRIGQLVFFETDPLETESDYAAEGKYQSGATLEELKANWKPQDMLPKQWLDREVRALAVAEPKSAATEEAPDAIPEPEPEREDHDSSRE